MFTSTPKKYSAYKQTSFLEMSFDKTRPSNECVSCVHTAVKMFELRTLSTHSKYLLMQFWINFISVYKSDKNQVTSSLPQLLEAQAQNELQTPPRVHEGLHEANWVLI